MDEDLTFVCIRVHQRSSASPDLLVEGQAPPVELVQ